MDATECFVFDGKNDFGLWRERVESQLISRGLLGHVLVRGYNGTQSFTHNGKHIQPNARQALSDAEVLKEENEAVSCLRRFLHPTVETQIAKLNAYDRWATLKVLYGCGGNAKINEMYRALDRMKFGDTKAESIDRFTTRWKMTLQQFEQATGSEFSDSLKSAMLEDALPTSWRPLVAGWQGARPITPFNELLGNVLAEDKRSTTRPREERAKSRPTSPARVPSERTRQSDGAEKCYYCLRSNHSFRQCRYLQKDIEKGSTHNPRASYSATQSPQQQQQTMEGAASSSSVRVFDGTTDFRVWRARVENELMRYHLLGYVMVRGYDGSQPFTFDGEEVPPRCPVIHVDDEQTSFKEEAACGHNSAAVQESHLSRWEVLRESADAKSILQRFLHPDVECAILNKNIYDSWKVLCALYGNRSSPGAHDVYEMHRVLHHIRLGDKKGEPVREFVTRWEMLVQQYALATGIELTDGFRSVSLVQTLPSAWRPMVASWRGIRPFVPYAELVEKVIATRERMQAQAEAAASAPKGAALMRQSSNAGSCPADGQVGQLPEKSADKSAAVKPVTQTATKSGEATVELSASKPTERPVSRRAKQPEEKPAEKRAAESLSPETTSKTSKPVPSPIDTSNNTVDLTSGKVSTTTSSSGEKKALTSTRSQDSAKKSSVGQSDKNSPPTRSSRDDDTREKNDTYENRSRYDKYASYSRYEKSAYKPYSKYDNDGNKYSGPVSCFYCLKVGHHMKRCWYLKADIENGTTHDIHKKYSCSVTIDRNQFMVNCLEAYIDEENRARAGSTTQRSHGDYEVAESVGRLYSPKLQQFAPPPPPGDPPSYAFRDQQPASVSSPSYRKRSHSVFQSAESRLSSRDPRLNRSRSVYRNSDSAEAFSPRKRSRAPSFEQQLQPYY
ncbi:hypothetical protein PR001_g315 [Phytophthora rubi]|uniref:CCHC-type domain-containing protein n=2 Tax=Phytophthora rubi TaxID=129364 RepID=A0A6A3PDW4_9STRA|nr:hypothetical protein PR001_g315 [Phytophthora rubi]